MSHVDVDRNLLFGVIALQDDFIDQRQFSDVCAGWAIEMKAPLADLLLERRWITDDDRRAIEAKIERKIRKHKGNVRASLGEVAGPDERDAIRAIDHPEVRKSLSSLPPSAGHVLIETLVKPQTEEGSRYSLIRMHAEGGLGKVWLARDGELNREVALKEIHPSQADRRVNWRSVSQGGADHGPARASQHRAGLRAGATQGGRATVLRDAIRSRTNAPKRDR